VRGTRRVAPVALLAAVSAAGTAACSGPQNALDPRGPQAAAIAELWWVMFGLGVAVFVAFTLVFVYAVRAARRAGEENDLPDRHGWQLVIWGGVAIPAVILLTLVVYSVSTDRRISQLGRGEAELLTVEVTGHQFWWELRYVDRRHQHREFRTANELHIPARRPVRLVLRSADVIHSLWIPNLHGKLDLIPGRENTMMIQADAPGVFRAQCAEFCGVQHAKMGMVVVAHTPEEFAAWWDRQLVPTPPPATAEAALGRAVFMETGCAMCHAVRGTEAWASAGPDLTRFGERRTIAAAWLPNTRGDLGAWLSDPQGVKPGNYMPAVPLDGERLQALITYLHSLR
jgi:cytochrome c oxidase subunit II